MGRSFAATTFLSAGNITHTPAYGRLIALGIETRCRSYGAFPQQIDNALAYRESIARHRPLPDVLLRRGDHRLPHASRIPPDRTALRIVRETDRGLVISGKVGMHTSPACAEDVYIGALCGLDFHGHRATFVVPVNAPGVTVICRRSPRARPIRSPRRCPAATTNSTASCGWKTCSSRANGVFLAEPPTSSRSPAGCSGTSSIAGCRRPSSRWAWRWPAPHAIGLKQHPTHHRLSDRLVTDVQTVRTCQIAAERIRSSPRKATAYPNPLPSRRPAASPC